MSLKEFIDNHPATCVASLIVAAVAATGTVVDYLNDRSNEALVSKHAAELTELRTSLNAQIRDLTTRLNSIERRSGDGTTFFDVAKLTIPPSRSKTLPKEFRPYRDGSFFVNAPSGVKWRHEVTTEADLIRQRFGKYSPLLLPGHLSKSLETASIDLWRYSDSLELSLSVRQAPGQASLSHVRLKFFPHVVVQLVSRQQIEELLKPQFSASALAKLLEDMSTRASNLANRPQPSESTSSWVEELGDAMFDDVTGFILMSYMQLNYLARAMFEDARFKVLSLQKKGNVVYLRSQQVVHGAKEEADDKVKIVVEEELFLVGTGSEILLVKVHVPSKHGQHDAFGWTTAWLAGLRIALET